jgi:opacity protein-like surface antigen
VPRYLIALAVIAIAGAAHAQPGDPMPPSDPSPSEAPAPDGAAAPAPSPSAAPIAAAPAAAEPPVLHEDVGDQAISAQLGIAAGGRVTPGGLRIAGQYFYQLSDEDWFDGGANFTFGSGNGACFRDRQDKVICSHGAADGTGVELIASVRRMFRPQGAFHPYARLGVGLGLARFADDDVTGVTIPAHGGGGVRIAMTPSIGFVVEADLALGFGSFNRSIGSQPQLGLAIAAGAEFRLR